MLERPKKKESNKSPPKVDPVVGSVEPKEHSKAQDSLGEYSVDHTGTDEIEGTSTGAGSTVKPISSQNTEENLTEQSVENPMPEDSDESFPKLERQSGQNVQNDAPQ